MIANNKLVWILRYTLSRAKILENSRFFLVNPLKNTRENIPHQEHQFKIFLLLSLMHVLHLSTRHTSPSNPVTLKLIQMLKAFY